MSEQGVKFVAPAIPDIPHLQDCHANASTEDDFFECVESFALPDGYRIESSCDGGDIASQVVCSTGNKDIEDAYASFEGLKACVDEGKQYAWDVAYCLGKPSLGSKEQYYLKCLTDNQGDYKAAAVCSFAKDLTPEQQIALSCAISTGGSPKAFVGCTAGKLTDREFKKCWANGVGTPTGCFGPNNSMRTWSKSIRDEVCKATGGGSDTCNAFTYWQKNVMLPGQNNEAVKAFNNALKDWHSKSLGSSNEIVKAGKSVGEAFQSIGSAFGF